MGIEKTAAKLATLKDVGKELDESLKSTRTQLARIEGEILLANNLSVLIEGLCQAVNNDLDENKIPISEPLLIAKYVKEYILKAKNLALEAGKRSAQSRIEYNGRIITWNDAIAKVKKLHDRQIAKLEALERSLDDEMANVVPINRIEGQHPGPSLKAQRLMEEKAQEVEKKPVQESEEKPKGEPKAKSKGKTRKRKKANK